MEDQEVCGETGAGSRLSAGSKKHMKTEKAGLTGGLVQAMLLSQSHVEVSRVGSLTLSYDATHTLHGKATRSPAQGRERSAGV